MKCGAYVTVISPEFSDELKKIHDENRDSITLLEREYMEGDLESSFLAFGATDSSEVNEAVRAEAEKKGILSNIADNPDGSLFIVNSSKSIGVITSYSIHYTKLYEMIYFPCLATVGAVVREAGSKVALAQILYMTVLAWIVSVLYYQSGYGHSLFWIIVSLGLLVLLVSAFFLAGYILRKKGKIG